MEKAQTDVVGQSLRDKIEGISFTTNPAFRKEAAKESTERVNELEAALERMTKRDKMLE